MQVCVLATNCSGYVCVCVCVCVRVRVWMYRGAYSSERCLSLEPRNTLNLSKSAAPDPLHVHVPAPAPLQDSGFVNIFFFLLLQGSIRGLRLVAGFFQYAKAEPRTRASQPTGDRHRRLKKSIVTSSRSASFTVCQLNLC